MPQAFILHIAKDTQKLLHENELDCIRNAANKCIFQVDLESNTLDFYNQMTESTALLVSEETLYELIKKVNKKPNHNVIVLHSNKLPADFSTFNTQITNLKFILSRPIEILGEFLLIQILNFIKNKSSFDLNKIFRINSPDKFEHTILSSNERSSLQEKIFDFFTEQIKKHQENLKAGCTTYAKNLSDIFDEFAMNAIWDANTKYKDCDRTQVIKLKPSEQVEISCFSDGYYFILKVKDPFGTFDDKSIGCNMNNTLAATEAKEVNHGTGGAGIGLIMTLQKIGTLVFEIDPQKSTTAYAIAEGTQSIREMQRRKKSILFFKK